MMTSYWHLNSILRVVAMNKGVDKRDVLATF
jgi:hypothetical protein